MIKRSLRNKSLIILTIFSVLSCSKKEEDSSTTTDSEYFAAAKAYITATTPFGSQTNLVDGMNIKVEFDPSITAGSGALNLSNVGYLATLRKKLTISSDNTLIMIERILPSQKDETTMTLTMRAGRNSNKVSNGGGGYYRERGYTDYACDRIVFNSTGQAVCLNKVDGVIQLIKLTPKFGERFVSACNAVDDSIVCGKRDKLVSVKGAQNGVLQWSSFRLQAQ